MSDIPRNLVPLARVWELEGDPDDLMSPLVDLIEKQFRAGDLVVYGWLPGTIDPVPVHPGRSEINWIGPVGEIDDYDPCAEPIVDLNHPGMLARIKDRRLHLAVSAEDWARLCDEVMVGLGFLPVVANLESKPKQGPEPPAAVQQDDIELKPAPARIIHEAIAAVYDEAESIGEKPPNVREIIAPTQDRLRALGYLASGNYIMQLAGEGPHKNRRHRTGVRWGRQEH